MKVIKFAPGLIPVLKHGTHDQKTHGNWAHGSSFGDFTLQEGADSKKLAIYSHPNGTRVIFQNLSKVESSSPMVKETLETIDALSKKYPVPNLTFVVQSGEGGGIVTRGYDGVCYSPANTGAPDKIQAWLDYKKMPPATDPNAPYIAIRQRVVAPDSVPRVTYIGAGGIIRPDKTQEQKTAYLKELITHEWGHALDTRSKSVSDAQFRNRDNASTSTYGNKNGREFFAETFAAFELGGLIKDKPDNIPNYKKASEYLEMDSLKGKVSKESFEGFVVYENFETGEPLLIEGGTPLDFDESVQKHQEHDQKTHGSWATGTPQGGNGLAHREIYQLQSGTSDSLVRRIYDAEERFQPNVQRDIPKPFPPSRTEFQTNAEYDKAYKEYSKAFDEWSRESTRNIKSTTGEKHLDGTKAGVQAYVNAVTSADWFIEAFGDGGVVGTPKVSLRAMGAAGQYSIGTKGGVGYSALAMDKGYSQAEPVILHELAHYATAISATSSYEGHGVEFAKNHIYMASKVISPEYAAGLEKAYREAGVPLG